MRILSEVARFNIVNSIDGALTFKSLSDHERKDLPKEIKKAFGIEAVEGIVDVLLTSRVNKNLFHIVVKNAYFIPNSPNNILSIKRQNLYKSIELLTESNGNLNLKEDEIVVIKGQKLNDSARDFLIIGLTDWKNSGNSKLLKDWHSILGHFDYKEILEMDSIIVKDSNVKFKCETCRLSNLNSSTDHHRLGIKNWGFKMGKLVYLEIIFSNDQFKSKDVLIFVDLNTGYIDLHATNKINSKDILNKLTSFNKFIQTKNTDQEGIKAIAFNEQYSQFHSKNLRDWLNLNKIKKSQIPRKFKFVLNSLMQRIHQKANLLIQNFDFNLLNYAILHSAYLNNCLPMFGMKSPFERICGFEPELKNLRNFGSNCFVGSEKRPSIYLGHVYHKNQLHYIVQDKKTKSVTFKLQIW
jgi:hypothetical protein